MNLQDLCQEYNVSKWDLTENDVKLIIDSGKEGKTWGEKTDIVMSKLCDLSGLDEYDVDEDKGLYIFYCKLCQLCESTMNIKEAKEVLKENGFIIEGWKDDRAEYEKVKAKKYNGEHYKKPYKKFNLGYGLIADLKAGGKTFWDTSRKAKLTVYRADTYKQILEEYIDNDEDSIPESIIKKLKRKIIAFAAQELDDNEMEKVIKNVNWMIKKIDTEWLGKANRRNARADVVDAKRKANEYDARMKYRNSWVTDMEDKVGEKVTYKNRNGYKHGQIVGIVTDKDNKEQYYKVKWNDNGKTQKINVKDTSLEPIGVEWYPDR